jgi:hypothetical protein
MGIANRDHARSRPGSFLRWLASFEDAHVYAGLLQTPGQGQADYARTYDEHVGALHDLILAVQAGVSWQRGNQRL